MAQFNSGGNTPGTVHLKVTCECGAPVTWPADAGDEYVLRCDRCGKQAGFLGEMKSHLDRTEFEFKRGLMAAFGEAWKKLRG
jgi:hypothetical protein